MQIMGKVTGHHRGAVAVGQNGDALAPHLAMNGKRPRGQKQISKRIGTYDAGPFQHCIENVIVANQRTGV